MSIGRRFYHRLNLSEWILPRNLLNTLKPQTIIDLINTQIFPHIISLLFHHPWPFGGARSSRYWVYSFYRHRLICEYYSLLVARFGEVWLHYGWFEGSEDWLGRGLPNFISSEWRELFHSLLARIWLRSHRPVWIVLLRPHFHLLLLRNLGIMKDRVASTLIKSQIDTILRTHSFLPRPSWEVVRSQFECHFVVPYLFSDCAHVYFWILVDSDRVIYSC